MVAVKMRSLKKKSNANNVSIISIFLEFLLRHIIYPQQQHQEETKSNKWRHATKRRIIGRTSVNQIMFGACFIIPHSAVSQDQFVRSFHKYIGMRARISR